MQLLHSFMSETFYMNIIIESNKHYPCYSRRQLPRSDKFNNRYVKGASNGRPCMKRVLKVDEAKDVCSCT